MVKLQNLNDYMLLLQDFSMWVGLGNIMSVERSQDDKVCSTTVQFVHKASYSGLQML